MKQDYLFFAFESKFTYSFRITDIHFLVKEICERHNLNAQRSQLLGNALIGCMLFSTLLQEGEQVNLRIQCADHFTIGTESDFLGNMRGYIDCNENSKIVKCIDTEEDWKEYLTVRSARTQKDNPKLFEGVTSIFTNSIEEALNDHLKSSYQMSTQLSLDCWHDLSSSRLNAFGVIFQELPNIPVIESQNLQAHLLSLPSMKILYTECSGDPDLLTQKMIPSAFKGLKNITPTFYCGCSLKKVSDAVEILPLEDLQDIIFKGENVEVKCHYCSSLHTLSISKVTEILKQKNQNIVLN